MNLPFSISMVLDIVLIIIVIGIILVILLENRNPQKSLSWILVLICLPVVGVLLYLFFGREYRKKHRISKKLYKGLDKEHYPLPHINGSEKYPEEYWKLIWMFSRINEAPVLSGNKVDFFTSGTDKFEALFADIEMHSTTSTSFIIKYWMIK